MTTSYLNNVEDADSASERTRYLRKTAQPAITNANVSHSWHCESFRENKPPDLLSIHFSPVEVTTMLTKATECGGSRREPTWKTIQLRNASS